MSNLDDQQFEDGLAPAGWTVNLGVVNDIVSFDDSDDPLIGLRSMRINGTTVAQTWVETAQYTPLTPVDFYFVFRAGNYPASSNVDIIEFLNAAKQVIAKVQISNSVPRFRLEHGTTNVVGPSTGPDAPVAGTRYAMWVDYSPSTENNGVMNLYYSSNPIAFDPNVSPIIAKDDPKISISAGTATDPISYVRFTSQNRNQGGSFGQGTVFFDNYQAETVIGDAGAPVPVVVPINIPGLIANPIESLAPSGSQTINTISDSIILAPSILVENPLGFAVDASVSIELQPAIAGTIPAGGTLLFGPFNDVNSANMAGTVVPVTITNNSMLPVTLGKATVIAFDPPPINELITSTSFSVQPPFSVLDDGTRETSFVSFDDTTLPAAGSGASMLLNPEFNDVVGISVFPVTAMDDPIVINEFEFYIALRLAAVPPTTEQKLFDFRDNDGVIQFSLNIRNNGFLRCVHGSTVSPNSPEVFVAGQFFEFIVQYAAETSPGANDGVCNVYQFQGQARSASPILSINGLAGGTAVTNFSIQCFGKAQQPKNIGGYILRNGEWDETTLIEDSEIAQLWAIPAPPKILNVDTVVIGDDFVVTTNEDVAGTSFLLSNYGGNDITVAIVSKVGAVYTLRLSRNLPIGTFADLTYVSINGNATQNILIEPPVGQTFATSILNGNELPDFSFVNPNPEFLGIVPGDQVTIGSDLSNYAVDPIIPGISYNIGLGQDLTIQYDPQVPVGSYVDVPASKFIAAENYARTDYDFRINIAPADVPGVLTLRGVLQPTFVIVSTITDPDGFDPLGVVYTWFGDDVPIPDSNVKDYTVTINEVGKSLRASAAYTDNLGNFVEIFSDSTALVTNPGGLG